MSKKVFISGCFDLLHSGHVEFFREAADYGDLYVAIGSDKTVYDLKGRLPVNNEEERAFMIRSIAFVKDAFVSKGSGLLDFEAEFRALHPDFLVVNEDGDLLEKRELCAELGAEYIVLSRQPFENLPARSTTALRQQNQIPFRIDLAGGWLDQPWVSKHCPGSVLTISLEPSFNFNERSGMASSTRLAAIELWGTKIPAGNHEKLAKILFCYDNPPGTKVVSGSQDSIGIVLPGLAKADYAGEYWPQKITQVNEAETLQFIENALYLVTLGPRHREYDVLENTRITPENAGALAKAAEDCWQAILNHDIQQFGSAFRASFEAQIAMFPNMLNNDVTRLIDQYKNEALGWKLSGAGGGGYLILISDKPIKNAMRIRIRREME